MSEITTVQVTKSNNFIKSIGDPRVRREFDDGTTQIRKFSGNVIPGVEQGKRIHYVKKEGRFPITLPQEELDEIVQSMHLFDNEGNAITTANRKNAADPFFTHEELRLGFEDGLTSYEKESPLGKLWRNYMENHIDYKSRVMGNQPVGLFQGRASMTFVDNKSLERAEEEANLDLYEKASNLMASMDLTTKVQALRAMGVEVRNSQISDKGIGRSLTKKVLREAEAKNPSGKTNIETFIDIAETPKEELNIQSLVKHARDLRIIIKENKGSKGVTYKYGEIPMGSTLALVAEFLSDKDNASILSEISEAIEQNDK